MGNDIKLHAAVTTHADVISRTVGNKPDMLSAVLSFSLISAAHTISIMTTCYQPYYYTVVSRDVGSI